MVLTAVRRRRLSELIQWGVLFSARGRQSWTMRLLLFLFLIGWVSIVRGQPAEPPRTEPALPPTAFPEILSPRDGDSFSKPRLTLRFRLPNRGSPSIPRVRVLIEGEASSTSRNIILTKAEDPLDEVQSIEIELPERDCVLVVSLEAESATGTQQRISLRWRGTQPPVPSTASVRRPNLFILAIGVSTYRDPGLQLRYPAKDAADLVALLQEQQGRLYATVQTRLLVDAGATRSSILAGMEWMRQSVTPRDVALLFVAGHGMNEATTGAYVFLPHDAELDALGRTTVTDAEIRTTLRSLPGKVLLFLDTCHSGNVLGSVQLRGEDDLTAFIQALASTESTTILFAASKKKQASRESSRWGNGAFTKALLEGLSGQADTQKTGRVTVNMLDLYLSERVKELTGGEQSPTTAKPGMTADFPLTLVAATSTRRPDPVHQSGLAGGVSMMPRRLLLSISAGTPLVGLDPQTTRYVPELAVAAALPLRLRVLALLPTLELRYEARLRTVVLLGYPGPGMSEDVTQHSLTLRLSCAVRLAWASMPLEVVLDPLGLRVDRRFSDLAQTRAAWEPAAALALRLKRWHGDSRFPGAAWLFVALAGVLGQPALRADPVFLLTGAPDEVISDSRTPWLYARAGAQVGF